MCVFCRGRRWNGNHDFTDDDEQSWGIALQLALQPINLCKYFVMLRIPKITLQYVGLVKPFNTPAKNVDNGPKISAHVQHLRHVIRVAKCFFVQSFICHSKIIK